MQVNESCQDKWSEQQEFFNFLTSSNLDLVTATVTALKWANKCMMDPNPSDNGLPFKDRLASKLLLYYTAAELNHLGKFDKRSASKPQLFLGQ